MVPGQMTVMSKSMRESSSEPRRGTDPVEEAYLRLVGERVRLNRVQRGMSRKALSQNSGVSERYLAELERGTGNASLLVLKSISTALSLRVEDLISEQEMKSAELGIAVRQLEQLSSGELSEVRDLISRRYGRSASSSIGRIALVGLRGAGKTALGRNAAQALGVPCIEIDREIERASSMDLPEIFAVHGDTVYRRLENESLDAVIGSVPRAIITTGGGIVLSRDTYDKLLANCFVVWVTASEQQLAERAKSDLGLSSQALTPRAREELVKALRAREPLYRRANAVIDTTGKSNEQVLEEFLRLVSAADTGKDRPV